MKLLVVTTSYPAHDGDPSGNFVRAEARALANQGQNEVHVVAPGGSPFDPPQTDPEAPSLHIHHAGASALFGWPGAVARLRAKPHRITHAIPFAAVASAKIKAIGRVDRAIAHWIIPSAFPLLLPNEAPLDIVAHGADVRLLRAMPASPRALILRSLLDRRATFRFVARTSLDTLTHSLEEPLGRRLSSASRIAPVHLELPNVKAHADKLRRTLEGSLPRPIIAVVGRLIPSKRVDLALAAAARAKASVIIIGDGPDRAELERKAQTLGTTAHFKGLVPHVEALAWIAAADVLLSTSETEAAPTVIREARALEIPVVACPAGDIATWAENDPHITMVPPTPNPIAEALHTAAANSPWSLHPKGEKSRRE